VGEGVSAAHGSRLCVLTVGYRAVGVVACPPAFVHDASRVDEEVVRDIGETVRDFELVDLPHRRAPVGNVVARARVMNDEFLDSGVVVLDRLAERLVRAPFGPPRDRGCERGRVDSRFFAIVLGARCLFFA